MDLTDGQDKEEVKYSSIFLWYDVGLLCVCKMSKTYTDESVLLFKTCYETNQVLY